MDIIIFGQMGAGKSTVANYLRDNYGYSKFSLGAKIHSECELYNKHDRQHMQKYGQMMREIFGINIWCDYVKNQSTNTDKVVIDDARQLNEYDYFEGLGYLTVAVVADDNKRIERLKKRVNYVIDPNTFNHETEVQARACINKCKITIYNNSDDLKELIEAIEFKLGEYLGGKI